MPVRQARATNFSRIASIRRQSTRLLVSVCLYPKPAAPTMTFSHDKLHRISRWMKTKICGCSLRCAHKIVVCFRGENWDCEWMHERNAQMSYVNELWELELHATFTNYNSPRWKNISINAWWAHQLLSFHLLYILIKLFLGRKRNNREPRNVLQSWH